MKINFYIFPKQINENVCQSQEKLCTRLKVKKVLQVVGVGLLLIQRFRIILFESNMKNCYTLKMILKKLLYNSSLQLMNNTFRLRLGIMKFISVQICFH